MDIRIAQVTPQDQDDADAQAMLLTIWRRRRMAMWPKYLQVSPAGFYVVQGPPGLQVNPAVMYTVIGPPYMQVSRSAFYVVMQLVISLGRPRPPVVLRLLMQQETDDSLPISFARGSGKSSSSPRRRVALLIG